MRTEKNGRRETDLNEKDVVELIREELFSMQDETYRQFSSKLMPTVDFETVIGVRTPDIRKLAKRIGKSDDMEIFMGDLPHKYYEENNIHSALIESIKDYDECVKQINRFLPFVDNWATCDMMRPKVFIKNKDKLIEQIKIWITDRNTYTVRFGIGMLMTHFLDDDFKPEYMEMACSIESEEYYINTMMAWFFATALAKQYESTLPILLENRLSPWVHNKTIQKAVESNRISPQTKEYLKTLKIKQL